MYLAEGQSVAICEKGAEAAIYGRRAERGVIS